MTVYRLILPDYALDGSKPRVLEGQFTQDQLDEYNSQGYNVYSLPNQPSQYVKGTTVEGAHIDKFKWCFVDMDLKDGTYTDKDSFIRRLADFPLPPTKIVDSGNGVHAYWAVSDLDAMSYLRIQRRLMRLLDTDEAVGQIFQLMRVPGTVNTKNPDDLKLCETLYEDNNVYTCEQLNAVLPKILHEDEEYCRHHYDRTYKITNENIKIEDKLPIKFGKLLRENNEVKNIWTGPTDDRSANDYRLGHIMFAHGFTKDEARSVLVNAAKALGRAPAHRYTYADNIVQKIWTYELEPESKDSLALSSSVKDILARKGDALKGTRFPCWSYLDATDHGFRLGQVIGLVAGSGVGKTAMALNMFMGFVKNNPDYDHFFVPLEQPANEIADRWRTMCGTEVHLHDKVHVISNYAEDGSFRHLSFDEIKDYILKFQAKTERKVGCVVIDHIGALKKKGINGENQALMDICHQMKAFAVHTNTMLVMQSQAPREKAGIGDLEINKDAAYGTVFFESYCDYLVSIWQPLKRCYAEEACPTVTAFKFCKIRHKKNHLDNVKEDVCYRLYFDSRNEHMRELTQDEETSFDYFNAKATNMRKQDRKTDVVPYKSITWTKHAT